MVQRRNVTTFTNLLVSHRVDPVSHAVNPRPDDSPAAIAEIQGNGALLVSRMPTVTLDALKATGQAVNGMIAYDETLNNFVLYQGNEWVSVTKAGLKEPYIEGPDSSEEGDMVAFGERIEQTHRSSEVVREDPEPVPVHYVKGPFSSKPGNLAVFKGETGSEVADSGLNVQKVLFRHPHKDLLEAQDVIQLKNLGELQFMNGLGIILVDDLIPVTFITRGTGADAQVCTVFGGDLPVESSSPSALVELHSTTGALLVSRMNTAQRLSLIDPQNGMIVYDTEEDGFFFYQNEDWTPLEGGGGGSGDVTGPQEALTGEIPLFDSTSGKKIGQSGVLLDQKKKMTGIKGLRISTPKPYDKNYSLWAESGVVALDYYVVSSQKFKTVLARDEEIHDEVESFWNGLSFVHYTRHHDLAETKHVGLIAEEVAEIAPHLVQEHEEGLALNKSALLDHACVMIQKLVKENKALHKQMTHQARKLDHFIKTFNLRAQKNGFPAIKFEEVLDE